MVQLQIQRSGLTYEAALGSCFGMLIDSPGRVLSAVLAEFANYDVAVSDLSIDGGNLEDRGISCEVEKLDASVTLRTDRVEIRFFDIEDTGDDTAAGVLQAIWKAIRVAAPEIAPRSHSLLYEMDCELPDGSYSKALKPFCAPPEMLPPGTETAIVYYLPPDTARGFLDSSVVLNRSSEVDGGVLLAVTLVFESGLAVPDVLQSGRQRLADLLKRLDLTLAGSRTLG